MDVLTYDYNHDVARMDCAEKALAESFQRFEKLAALTDKTYAFANSMQTSQRKIPFSGGVNGVGTNYHWRQLVPLYKKELEDFQAMVARLHEKQSAPPTDDSGISSLPTAAFKLSGTNAETYIVKIGERVFADRNFEIQDLAPELKGLTGIRFAHEAAKKGKYQPVEFELTEPAQVLVGYFKSDQKTWLQVPNLETAAQADERGGIEPVIENAAMIEGCPSLDIHSFRYGAGRQKLEMIGKGSFVVLGIVPESAVITPRDAGRKAIEK